MEKATYTDFLTEYVNLGADFGTTFANRSLTKLSCHSTEQMWFDVMRSYSGIGQFLGIFSLFVIVLYFVTSSDSGSLVIDCLNSNGDPDPPKVQRVFWAVWAYAIPFLTCFVLFIGLHLAEIFVNGCWALAWCFYLGFVAMTTSVRIQCRDQLEINGNAFEDFLPHCSFIHV